jgi:hypothetical protein
VSALPYQPFWCEENVWHLVVRDDLGEGDRSVVFVSNAGRQVALWEQKASREPDGLVVWDYHVVLRVGGMLWDLDTRLPCPLPARAWVDATFRPVAPEYAPRFRVIEAAVFRDAFASDRRHMKDEHGQWRAPPPPWPAIGDGHTLPEFIDVARPFLGDVVDLEGLRARL